MNELKILLVEDNLSFAVEIEMIIEDLGYKVLEIVDNAEKALTLITEYQPDLIIADISLKGAMNGVEMVEQIKDYPGAVIFITQYRDQAFYQKAKALRPVAYLIKPFDKLTLQSCIETAFSILVSDSDVPESADTFLLADSFFIKNNNNVLSKVNILDIQSIAADGNYCDIHLTSGKRYAIKISLVNILKKLPSDQFIRIHKSHVIQANLISQIDSTGSKIFIADQAFPMGRTFKEAILKRFKRL